MPICNYFAWWSFVEDIECKQWNKVKFRAKRISIHVAIWQPNLHNSFILLFKYDYHKPVNGALMVFHNWQIDFFTTSLSFYSIMNRYICMQVIIRAVIAVFMWNLFISYRINSGIGCRVILLKWIRKFC